MILVPFFATNFGARFTSGLVVPLLLFADVLAGFSSIIGNAAGPAVSLFLLGVLFGKPLVRLIPEREFRFFIMTIALLGALQLLFGG